MKKINIIILMLALFAFSAQAQIYDPVKWTVASKKLNNNEAVVFVKATIESGWHIYSLNVGEGGPIATSFDFSPSKEYSLVGKVAEPKALTKYEDIFKMDVSYFTKEVVFQQRVKLTGKETTVKGVVEYMACDASRCLPPEEHAFAVTIK